MILGFGGYGYHLYSLFRDLQINKPQHQVEKLIRDLRLYYTQMRRFPQNFIEINERLWRTQPAPDYGVAGRQAHMKNCYYCYTKVSDETCAFWALPLGSQRHYASSFFVALSPGWMRAWKGQAMSDEEIAQIPAIPSPGGLAELKMCEMSARIFGSSNGMQPLLNPLPLLPQSDPYLPSVVDGHQPPKP
ncbi:MAG: hypothetical protein MOB07_10520 [Acidobacteria bacterium]|nr:hypothetical protein [Acidobacteriota bacterium]